MTKFVKHTFVIKQLAGQNTRAWLASRDIGFEHSRSVLPMALVLIFFLIAQATANCEFLLL